ncbi:MAG: S-methyl thiohydantoin desulfurase domain-containing protein, partial [Candidatus Baldrarchaeia archaeon]
MLKLDKQQIEDLLVGAKILGTGGGGEIEWVRPLIEEVFDKGKEFVLVDPNEVPDDELVVMAARLGGGVTAEEAKMVEGYREVYERPELTAVEELSRYLGKSPYALIPAEIGAGNTLAPMYVAAMLDKVTVDGDACGRA